MDLFLQIKASKFFYFCKSQIRSLEISFSHYKVFIKYVLISLLIPSSLFLPPSLPPSLSLSPSPSLSLSPSLPSLLLLLLLSLPPSPPDTCTIKSRFEVSSGPTVPTPALVQFMCDGSTLSGVTMAIENPAYKISLHKNKCFSGKGRVDDYEFNFCLFVFLGKYMAEPIK